MSVSYVPDLVPVPVGLGRVAASVTAALSCGGAIIRYKHKLWRQRLPASLSVHSILVVHRAVRDSTAQCSGNLTEKKKKSKRLTVARSASCERECFPSQDVQNWNILLSRRTAPCQPRFRVFTGERTRQIQYVHPASASVAGHAQPPGRQ